ncbi:MAG: phosphorylase [Acaryochloridaceae cyanobacterium RL_2_7]|nr:phosphorylase [Acaryochloridaceae cyanobacterium RL_2_7]
MSQAFPQSLWSQIRQTFAHALDIGALKPIPTSYEWVEQDGISFLIRIVDNLWRKERAAARGKASPKPANFNPFLPYDEDLFVCNLSASHCILLNKFNVMDHHILIVTREFESQQNWLTLQDFEAIQKVIQEIDGLGFYNGGKLAGASQPHKHLQLVPLPLSSEGPKFPFAPCLESLHSDPKLTTANAFPYPHRICSTPALDAPEQWFLSYAQLMKQIGMGNPQHHENPRAHIIS